MAADDLVVSVQLETSPGVFLELEDEANGLTVAGTSFAARAVTHDNTEMKNRWTEGSLIVSSVRQNIIEPLVVNITGVGGSHYDFATKYNQIAAAFEQPTYRIIRLIGDWQETWTCLPCDSSLATQVEFFHAHTGVLSAQVPRLPSLTTAQVTG